MKHYDNYKRVVATKERSAGNDSVGDMWIETKVFNKDDNLEDVISWASDCSGRLILTIDESSALSNF
jgi:hypothetical protein